MKIPFNKKWVILEKEDYANYLFIISPWEGFTYRNPEFGFKNCRYLGAEYIHKACNVLMPAEVYHDLSKTYLQTIFTKPKLWDKLHESNIYYAKETIKIANQIKKLKPNKLSRREIIKWLSRFEKIQQSNHDRRGPMFVIEAKDNLFSNYLMEYLNERTTDLKVQISPMEAFQVLTTPTKKSIIKKEKEELIKIALIKNKNTQTQALKRHTKKYEWLEYGLQGKILNEDYFKKQLAQTKRQGVKKLAGKALKEIKDIQEKQKQIIKKLKIHPLHQQLFKIARDSIYCKVYSKDAQIYSYYACENLFKEVAKRGGLTLEQFRFLSFPEYNQILLEYKDLSKITNQRIRHSIHISDHGKTVIYQGEAAKKISKKIKRVKEKGLSKSGQAELKGNPAYPGKATGKVKIINTTQEMMKMHQGDILVSHMTNPDIVPVMKMASAIVTDLGGITCHAAIISRELNIPCIIGTKIATQVLKDGDRVEIDANKGIVKKIQ